jgi:uncharacterized membrane protein YdbT with pleckstrin-like domain
MSYIESSLSIDEKIVALFNLNKYTMIAPYLLFALSFAILLLGKISPGGISPLVYFGVSVITFITGLVMFFQIKSLEYGATNKRIIAKRGIIARRTDEILNKAVETVEVAQPILGRILGYGDIIVTGRGNSTIIFKGIDEPLNVKKFIEEAVFSDQ